MEAVIKELESSDIGKVIQNVPLSKYTTYKTGGVAKAFVYPKSVTDLIKVLKILKANSVKYKILGNGSNVLFSDRIYNGVIIKLDELNEVTFFGRNKVKVGAGYSLMKLAILTAKKGFSGLEFASGIPGTVGGAVFMNAGAYKSDMGYVVVQATVLTPDFKVISLENKELDFHYRTSFLKKHPGYICLEATIKLVKGDRSEIEEVIKERRKRRIASQPLEYPSAGSVFRNPDSNFAGKLIEDIGFKGKKIGGAMVSEKHANFIINYNHATSSEIKNLIDEVHDKVMDIYGVDLKIEQELVNWE